jgi:hypothetical protein
VRAAVAGAIAIAALSTGCASSSSGPKPPAWLLEDARSMFANLGDPNAKVSYRLGPAPLVIVEGDLTCAQCSGPPGSGPRRGSVAVSRFDAYARQGRDFTIGEGTVRELVASLCRAYGPSCARGGKGVPKVLDEGVSFGVTRRVQRFSDAESRRRTEAALQAWRKAIRTRADRWPQYRWNNRRPAAFQRSLERIAQRYGLSSVEPLVWRKPRQLAPELVFRTTHYVAAGRAIFRIVGRLMTGYEGYYVEADDERGIPFIYVMRYRRGPSGGGSYWARSDAVAPFLHG